MERINSGLCRGTGAQFVVDSLVVIALISWAHYPYCDIRELL